ncbi:MAG TPA: 2OG-Fe(II) oxygenase [Acetobacteraceae bacterium]|nr:2OG-Fe(II) oxygenase [Acetobacteraceae bacterium]
MDMLVCDRITLDHAGAHVRRALRRAAREESPFRYWLLRSVLPRSLCRAVSALPFPPPAIEDTLGRRETNNPSRIFVSAANRRRYPACETLADAFQDDATIGLIEDICRISLAGSYLRIECCLDSDGFWLEPHTDIGAKLFTMLVYLSDHPDAEDWGTDIMDPFGTVLGRAPGSFNSGLVFVPGSDTWHGFTRRPIRGVRRSLIVNYVKPEWRSRHELAFPETPVFGD